MGYYQPGEQGYIDFGKIGGGRDPEGDAQRDAAAVLGANRVQGLLDAVPQSIKQTDAQTESFKPENNELAMKTMQDVYGYAQFLRGLADDQKAVVWPHIVNKINMQDATFAKIANLDPSRPPSTAEIEAILMGTGKTDAIKGVLDSRVSTANNQNTAQANMAGKMFDFQSGMVKQQDQQQADLKLKEMELGKSGLGIPTDVQAKNATLVKGIGKGVQGLFAMALNDPEPQGLLEKGKRLYENLSLAAIEALPPAARTEYQHRLIEAYVPVRTNIVYLLSGASATIPEAVANANKIPMPQDFKTPGIRNPNITLAEENAADLIDTLKDYKEAARTKAAPEKRQEIMEGIQEVIDSTTAEIAKFRAKKDAEAGDQGQSQQAKPTQDRVAGFIAHLKKNGKSDQEIQNILSQVK